jgi:hypothetical protein
MNTGSCGLTTATPTSRALPITWWGFVVWFQQGSEPAHAVLLSTYGLRHERLVAMRNKCGPGKPFRMNSSIRPSA